MKYYVYFYINPIDGIPFYIGKGSGKRSHYHLRLAKSNFWKQDSNKLKMNKIRKILSSGLDPIIEIKEKNLSETESFEREKFYILEYGRIDLGTGVLTNLSDGGDGQRNWNPPLEYKLNMSKITSGEKNGMFGKNQKEETKNKIREKALGRKPSESAKKKMSESHLGDKNYFYGRKHSENSLDKMSKNRIGKCVGETNCSAKVFIFTSPSGEIFEVNGGFINFCKKNNLSEGRMKRFINMGEIPECDKYHNMTTEKTINCKGWKVENRNLPYI